MGKLSASQLSRIVALELIPEHVDVDQVKHQLGTYGRITDVQFWRSNNEKRHGFVTFQDPEAARSCLDHAPPTLGVKALHKTIIPRYIIPPISPKGRTKSIGGTDDQSPSLISRMSLSQPVTPTRQPHVQLKQDSAPGHAVDASGQPPRPASSLPWIQRTESHLTSNGTHELPQQRNNSISNDPLQMQQSLSARPSRSQYRNPDPPNSITTEPHQVRDRNDVIHDASENKRHEAEIIRLKHEIQELHSTMRNIKDSRDSALEDVTEKAHRYKKERDDLFFGMEAADKCAKYFKSLSEDLKLDLDRERNKHEDNERALQRDLRNSSKDISDLKRQLEVQSRVLSQRVAELSQSKQQLRAMNLEKNAHKSLFSEKERDEKSHIQQARNSSEPEEGQLKERPIGPSNHSPRDPSHRRMVLPALEKAFIYLEELTNAALLEVQPVSGRGSNPPNKRQRLNGT